LFSESIEALLFEHSGALKNALTSEKPGFWLTTQMSGNKPLKQKYHSEMGIIYRQNHLSSLSLIDILP
jgi:hypothetical protein